jgi:hypothetical protein
MPKGSARNLLGPKCLGRCVSKVGDEYQFSITHTGGIGITNFYAECEYNYEVLILTHVGRLRTCGNYPMQQQLALYGIY